MPAVPLREYSRVALLGLLAVFAGLAACTDEGDNLLVGPDETDVAGAYEAETLEFTEDGTTVDVLAAGGELTLVLDADGTATGDLFVPGGNEDGSDIDRQATGTWNFDDVEDQVTLHFESDEIMLNEVGLDVVTRNDGALQLEAQRSIPQGGTVNVVLVQRP